MRVEAQCNTPSHRPLKTHRRNFSAPTGGGGGFAVPDFDIPVEIESGDWVNKNDEELLDLFPPGKGMTFEDIDDIDLNGCGEFNSPSRKFTRERSRDENSRPSSAVLFNGGRITVSSFALELERSRELVRSNSNSSTVGEMVVTTTASSRQAHEAREARKGHRRSASEPFTTWALADDGFDFRAFDDSPALFATAAGAAKSAPVAAPPQTPKREFTLPPPIPAPCDMTSLLAFIPMLSPTSTSTPFPPTPVAPPPGPLQQMPPVRARERTPSPPPAASVPSPPDADDDAMDEDEDYEEPAQEGRPTRLTKRQTADLKRHNSNTKLYKCSRCGQIKANHICPLVVHNMVAVGVQADAMIPASLRGEHTISVSVGRGSILDVLDA
ncbi:hypothetical protein M885DRAFT_521618 [Pelagophyceae sp. CCMP2097]|nr:hypothetical protein M885DRAFT_521618 [Pelagophyceae sp. CCMP2097]